MTPRFVALTLAFVSLTGCKEVLEKLAKKGDAGATTVASADPPPAPATDDDNDNPSPQPTGAATTAAKTTSTAKTAAPASPADLEKAFAALDINDDNQLDGIEVKNCGCSVADANGDGEITKAEYLAAGLLGKFRPGATPTTTARTTPTNAPTNAPNNAPTNAPTPTQPTPPPPAPAAGGLPPGDYRCSALVGGILSTMGTVRIIDGSRYSGKDGSGAGNYTFDPGTREIRFTSGMYADPSMVKSARQVSDRQIQMRQGKNGFTVTDCKR